jgi:hypothetical protein
MAQASRRGPRGPKGDRGDPGTPGGGYDVDTAEFEGDGTTAVFTLPNGPVPAGREKGVHVFVNGLARNYRAVPATSSEFKVSGSTLTFGAAPPEDATVYVTHEK